MLKQRISMDKIAQERGVLNKLREKVNIPGSVIEGFFKPELDRIMNDLRQTDDNIRSILTGQKIGKSDVDVGGKSVKDLLKSARSNFNRREYMMGVADLGQFHKKLADVTKFIGVLDMSINRIHHDFLFQNLKDDQRENIQGLREYMGKTSEVQSDDLTKEAGIMDFFYNIGTKRGRALAVWEKKYPKVVKDLRDGGNRLLDMADSALANILGLLKVMAAARATRKVDSYVEAANKIKNEYAKFDNGDKGFRAYYTSVIKPYLDRQDEFERQDAAKNKPIEVATPTGTAPPPVVAPSSPTPAPGATTPGFNYDLPIPATPATPPAQLSLPLAGPPGASPPFPTPPPEEAAPDTEREPAVFPLNKPKTSHQNFYESLQSLSDENPHIIARYIAKYATSIEKSDPETAVVLFNVIRKIKG
jgi:hypothetical protein